MLHITLSKVFSQINHKEIGILKNRQSVQTPSGVSELRYFTAREARAMDPKNKLP